MKTDRVLRPWPPELYLFGLYFSFTLLYFSYIFWWLFPIFLYFEHSSVLDTLNMWYIYVFTITRYWVTRGLNFIGRGRGGCNSCLGKPLVHEGTTAIPVTVEGYQGKFKNSKGASRQTMHLFSFDKLHLKEWEKRCRFGVPPPLGTVLNCFL